MRTMQTREQIAEAVRQLSDDGVADPSNLLVVAIHVLIDIRDLLQNPPVAGEEMHPPM